MNVVYKSLWNAALGAWVAVCETARARGKRTSSKAARGAGAMPWLAMPLFALSSTAWGACVATGNTLNCTGTTPGWVNAADGSTINNSGTIGSFGDGTWGIYTGANITVNNTGTISGTSGVVLGANAVINNNGGTIRSSDRAIQVTGGPVTLTNSNGGLIEGLAGALIYSGGTIVNTGNSTIRSNGNYLGLGFGGGSASITNTAGSTIQGAAASIYGQSTSITLDNGGILRGSVALDGGLVQRVTLRTGSQIFGDLSIGGAAGSTLTLAGTGTQRYSQAASGNTSFGGDLIKNDAGDWLIDRTMAPRTATVSAGALGFGGGSFGAATAVNLAAAGTRLYTDSGAAVIGKLTGVAGSQVALAAGSSLRLGDGSDTTIASNFSGGGTLVKSGSGMLALAGDNTGFSGRFEAQAGTLQASSASAIGGASLGIGGAVNVVSPGPLALNNIELSSKLSVLGVQTPGAVSFDGVVSGAGALDLRAIAGSVALLANNTHAGGTRLGSNAVVLGSNSAFGTGAVAVDGTAVVTGQTALTLGNGFALAPSAALTVAGPAALTFTGPISGAGSLVKQGAGVMTLGGASSYEGGTTVSGGTLAVNNTSGSATGTGAVQVLAGAVIAGNGAVGGPVNVGAGARLNVGNGGVGVLSTGGLTLAAGSTLEMELGQAGVAGGPFNDLLNVNGNLSLGGTLALSQSAGGTFGAGLYRLINYTGTLTSNTMTIGSAPTAQGYLSLQTGVANQVNLLNTNGLTLNLWDGGHAAGFNNSKVDGGSGIWRAGGPGDSWTDANGIVNSTWTQDGFAVFSGKAGTVTVDNKGAAGAVRMGGAQFAVDGYTVEGEPLTLSGLQTVVRVGDGTAAGAGMQANIAAAIGGTGTLVKDDLGTLVLGGQNSYSGGTSVKGGILQISQDANLGQAGKNVTLQGGTLRIAAGATPLGTTRSFSVGGPGGTIDLGGSIFGIGGVVSGTGPLTVTGKGGTLSLAQTNTHSGGTRVQDGATVVASASGALGVGDVRQEGNGSTVAWVGGAAVGSNSFVVGRAGTADANNRLAFAQNANAAKANITINGAGWQSPTSNTLQFGDNANAGSATISNLGGSVVFQQGAQAGSAQISNGANSLLSFADTASAGKAQITNAAGGMVRLAGSASGAQASVSNAAGAVVDVSGTTAAGGTALGALAGAGNVVLGATRLQLGGLGGDSVVSGVVSDKGSVFAQPGSGTGGSIVKVGAGTLGLSGANNYTGGTTVAAGTLSVTNTSGSATGSGAVQVLSGARLVGNGSIAGSVSVANGGALSAGNGGAGTLSLGSLSLASGAELDYELGQAGVAGGAFNDLINVNGNLQLDGTLNVAQSTGGKFGAGLYRLMNYTGTLTDNGLEVGSAPGKAGTLFVQTSVDKQVNLVNTDGLALNVWDGTNSASINDGKIAGGSGSWRAGGPGDYWTDANGLANGSWAQDGFAIFAGKAGNVTVDNQGAGGAVRMAGAQFAVSGYSVGGDALTISAPESVVRVGDGSAAGAGMVATINAAIAGAGGLVKDDLGTLVLNGSNSYAGGTTVRGGVLQIASDAAMGAAAGKLALQNATLRVTGDVTSARAVSLSAGGNFNIDAARQLVLGNVVSGTGGLRKTGAGALRLGSANSFAGGSFVDAGTLATDVTGALGSGAVSVASGAALQLGGNFNAGSVAINNAGNVRLQGNANAGTGTFTNAAGSVLSFADAASAAQATVNNAAGAQLRIDQAAAGVSVGALAGPGDVLLGARTLTTGALNASSALSGTVSGAGGSLVKVGSGTLDLSAANSYSGSTTVAAGTLAVNNTAGSATGSGAVQVQSGATLAGTGSVLGNVSIAKGGVLSAGNGGVGTLTLGGLSLADGAVLAYELGQAGAVGGPLNDRVQVNGNLLLDGTLNVAQSKGGSFGAGIYRLIDYTGTLTDNGLELGSAPVATSNLQVQTSVAQQVNLVNRSGLSLNFWDGGNSANYNDGKVAGGTGTWRVGVPGDGWTGADGKINAAWTQDQFAVFGGAGGTVSVSKAGGTVRIAGAQFAADGYVLQGDAIELGAPGTVVRVGDGSGSDSTRSATVNVALVGAGGLVKDDVGRLILGGNNSYSGGTTVKAGVLQGDATSLQGRIVNDAEVVFDQGKGAGTYAGAMSGSGRLRKTGSGTLNLAGANSHAGGTFVDVGTLATDVTGALGTGAASVALGATLQIGGKAELGAMSVSNGGTVRLQDDASAGSATIANAAKAVLAFAGNARAEQATVSLGAGAQLRIDEASTGVNIGALDGAGDIALGAKALTLGGLGRDATLAGVLSGTGGSLVKEGSGTLTLTGANSYSGGTVVSAGMLSVNNKSGSATGTGAVQVQTGATLSGSGRIAGTVTVDKGGSLSAGNSPGTLSLGALTLAAGATLNYELGQAGVPGGALNDLIDVAGDVQLDGTLNIAQSAGGSFGPGLYRLMNHGGTLTDNGLQIGTVPASAKVADLQVQTSVANQVNLVNRAGLSLNFWDGGDSTKYNDGKIAGGSGIWRAGVPQPSLDGWTDANGKLNANWAQDQFAIFGGKAGTVTVQAVGGPVRIAGAQFASDGYVLQGDSLVLGNANSILRVGDGTAAGADMTATLNVALSGTGGLVKEDAGRLILGGTNSYAGGTRINAGVLQGNADSLQGSIVNQAELVFDQDKTAGTFSGAISGTGGLRKIGVDSLTLASANTYRGGTQVDAGTLAAEASGALGTGPVSIAAGANLQFGANADAGALAITNAGSLQLQGNADAANARVTGAAGSEVRVDQSTTGVSIGALDGTADIVLGSKTLSLGALGTDSTLAGTISGSTGSLIKTGAGTLTLAGTASHGGETRVAAGTLRAGAAGAFSAASRGVVEAGATLDLAGFDQRMAALDNAGTVSLVGSVPGTALTVAGPYVGRDGLLRLAAKLDNPGIADRLVLDGATASASGHTRVQIVNLGGLGAATTGPGIEVISARNAATTTAQTSRDAFALEGGHIDAGAFRYRLHAGDAGGAGENWYLRTDAAPGTGLHAYRPEASLFSALPNQLRQGNLSMLSNLRQRIGDDDASGGEGQRRAWARVISTDIDMRQSGTVLPGSEGRVDGVQAGTDLLAARDWRAGIYVGQLEGDARVRGFNSAVLNSDAGRSELRSHYLGVYGTYTHASGFYADAVVQSGRHRYTARPFLGTAVGGKGNSVLASIELGQAFAIGSTGWSVEPQLQLIHQRLRMDELAIAGAQVQQQADKGWTARAGLRVKGSMTTGAGTLTPYGRLNIYRSTSGADVARFVSPAAITPVQSQVGGTSTELAAGFTLDWGHRTSVYGELGRLWATGGAARVGSSLNASVGVRVKW